MKNPTISEKFAKKQLALDREIELSTKFFELTGIEPNICSPENNPFAVFYPKTKADYLHILNTILPTNKDAQVTFAGKDAIQTFCPYLVTYGGEHNTPNYMEAVVKYPSDICPVWVKMPDEVRNEKFTVSSFDGEHKGFGRYERKYTLTANEGRTTVQEYYGRNKTMYAATPEENSKLYQFIIS